MPKRLSIKAKEALLDKFKAGHVPDNHLETAFNRLIQAGLKKDCLRRALRGPKGGAPWNPAIATRIVSVTDVLLPTIPPNHNVANRPYRSYRPISYSHMADMSYMSHMSHPSYLTCRHH